MKIKPVKNYKKPNYAMRFASMITAAGSLAGCSTAPQIDGDVAVADTEPATAVTDVEIVGMIEQPEETCVELDGDIAVLPEVTTTVMHNGEVLTEDMIEEIRSRNTTTAPAVTIADSDRIAVPGMAPVTEETAPAVTTKRSKQTYTTATTTELEIGGVITTASEKVPATTTATELTLSGDICVTTQTTTEVTTAGVAPIYTEETTTTEPELAGDVMIDGGIMPYME